uniref:hypothetical protein n=1 Tax=Cyanobium sp. TaxID=2164130 RepID=UPI0040491186
MNHEASQRVKSNLIDGADQFGADSSIKFIDIKAAIHKPAAILPDHKGWFILVFQGREVTNDALHKVVQSNEPLNTTELIGHQGDAQTFAVGLQRLDAIEDG